MGAGHASSLYLDVRSPVHRLAPQCKLAATIAFVLAVVATPREAVWAYGLYAALVVAVATVARVPLTTLARRLTVETPFVLFAVLLPFVARGERTEVLGVALSVDGLWAAWNVLAKATLGVASSILLAATTTVPALLRGLERLGVPRTFTAIAGFMVRYADLITGEMHRMRIARISRGHDPRWFWQARAVASSAGALFVRSYERGERVHLAMQARGYTGALPVLATDTVPATDWARALLLPLVAAVVAAAAWVVR